MPYPEELIRPMREELRRLGIKETRTPQQVDDAITGSKGTVMVVVNSVCGCAAGKARPGIALALKHSIVPDHLITVFAGADVEAAERARYYLKGYPPSSPSIAILRDGKLLYMLERREIEGRDATEVAQQLITAFDKFCAPAGQQPNRDVAGTGI